MPIKIWFIVINKIDSFKISKRNIPVFDNNGLPNKNTRRYITQNLQNQLISNYMNDPLKISEDLDVLDETDLLIIAKPRTSFSEKELFIIDQFIMNGGKTMWLIDMLDVNESILKILTSPMQNLWIMVHSNFYSNTVQDLI